MRLLFFDLQFSLGAEPHERVHGCNLRSPTRSRYSPGQRWDFAARKDFIPDR